MARQIDPIIYPLTRVKGRTVHHVNVGNLPKAVAEQYIADLMKKFRERDKRRVTIVKGYSSRWLFFKKKRLILIVDDGVNMFSKVWKASKMMKKVKTVENLRWWDAKKKYKILDYDLDFQAIDGILDCNAITCEESFHIYE